MGNHITSNLRVKSRSSSDLDRIRPISQQRTPKSRGKLASLALSSSRPLSKLSFKRKGGSKDNVKSFRDLISTWPLTDVEALFREFETWRLLSTVKEEADKARPEVPCIGKQLLNSSTQNFSLCFKGASFKVHKCVIMARCDTLRDLISQLDASAQELILDGSGKESITEQDISDFIEYVYTSNWIGVSSDVLEIMKDWWGCHGCLADDLLEMEKMGKEEGDLTIVLTTPQALSADSPSTSFMAQHSVRCHSELVAARSTLLKGLIARSPSQIILDEALLPRGFAALVVHFLYTDELDLKKISDSAISQSSLSEARAIVAGRSPQSPLHRAIQIIHLAMFFSLERLAQLCEDVMVSSLCVDSCVSILSWALDGGSPYVARQAQRFLEQEFSRIAPTHHLFDISLESMISCLNSQFVQATEVEILDHVVRWGEHELLKRMEEREPNVVADTSHSISRKGVRRADLSGEELNLILSPLTRLIRTDYVLPPFHQSLNNAYRRGILERAPLQNLVCPSTSEINPDIHWFRPGQFATGPRFYTPYFATIKSYLFESLERYEIRPSSISAANLNVVIENQMPEILDDATFEQVRSKIVDEINRYDHQHQLRFFPRYFHRKYAVEMISLRVIREMGVDPDSLSVYLECEEEKEVADVSSVSQLHCSQPLLNWPDIMTLERKKKHQSNDQISGEFDPTPDDESTS